MHAQTIGFYLTATPAISVSSWVWLLVASFLAGVLNAVAGGGSFLNFPAMLATGMLPIQANATNTVALWPGQLTSIAAYWQDLKQNLTLAWPMGLAGLLGGTAGAILLLHTPQSTFLNLVPWLLLVAAVIFAVSDPVSKWLQARAKARAKARTQAQVDAESGRARRAGWPLPLFLATIVVCFYIGYFGAGAGFLIISLLAVFGVDDIHQINALKVVSTTMANGVAFFIFVVDGQVVWRYCLASMASCAVGGYLSARLAHRVDRRLMHWVVVSIGLSMAAYFFWRKA